MVSVPSADLFIKIIVIEDLIKNSGSDFYFMDKERGVYFEASSDEVSKDAEVFYNPEMRLNRDISDIAVKVFSEIKEGNLRYCDATAGSGIRAFRNAEDVDKLYINDPNPEAQEAIKKGLKKNNLDAEVTGKDANVLLSEKRNFFHVIDVDPFGPFTKFLDSAARASNHSSFAGFTATDNSAPSGSYSTVCERRYGSKPVKNSFMHETGLRIYIKEVFQNYARFDKSFEPKICFHQRHYSRISGRITESKRRTNRQLDNIGYLSFCPNCRWRELERKNKCEFCGNEDLEYAGPLWTGKFADQRFTEKMLEKMPKDWEESREFLELLDSEASIRTPYYDLHEMASELDVQSPKRDEVVESLQDKGYMVSRTHFAPTGLRTDAPFGDVREKIKENSSSNL